MLRMHAARMPCAIVPPYVIPLSSHAASPPEQQTFKPPPRTYSHSINVSSRYTFIRHYSFTLNLPIQHHITKTMSSSTNPNKDATSTLQSYVDSASGAVQSALGSLTGSTGDKNVGEQKKAVADAEKDLSHTAAKIGGVTATPAGGLAKDDPNRTAGNW
jgi:uncharacterized protein YjbJ (UPF0337 family)